MHVGWAERREAHQLRPGIMKLMGFAALSPSYKTRATRIDREEADEPARGLRRQIPDRALRAARRHLAGDVAHRGPVAALGFSAAWRIAGSLSRHRRRPRQPRRDPDRHRRRVLRPPRDPRHLLLPDKAGLGAYRPHSLGRPPSLDAPP